LVLPLKKGLWYCSYCK